MKDKFNYVHMYEYIERRIGAYHDGNKRLLELLIDHLSGDVYPREPAAITRVAMIPPQHILQSTNLQPQSCKVSYRCHG